jgi:iron complex outermembrane recepter protein
VLSGALAPAVPSPFGAAGPLIVAGLDRLDGLNNLGSTQDIYNQNSRNWALFTHNIFHVTDQFDVTVGLRYTRERKRFDATFGNNNTVCTANQASLLPFVQTPGLAPVVQAILGLSCQGNSTAELNGVSINDRRSEGELTGTGILSYRPDNDWMFYASYSRGYKAGGFNLDRSALKAPVLPFAAVGGAQALVGNLQFDPEIVDAFEIGAKFSRGPLTINAAIFRQNFSNFQLNTFNGTVFIVQNINGCSADLGGADRDQNRFPTAPNFDPNARATGGCSADDVTYGVRSQGLEVEAAFSPRRDLRFTAGFTWADTQYRSNLVGNDTGAPLDQALRVLPGNRLSNAPELVVTGSMTWTPRLGNSGLTGLFYVDTRLTSDYNTGSDLFPQKEQDSYALVNARIGVRGPGERWALELWAQNLFGSAFYIFLLRQFFLGLPRDLFDAAKIDGANNWTIFARVAAPLCKPALIITLIFEFQAAWTDLMRPLIYLRDGALFTLPRGLKVVLDQFGQGGESQWEVVLAASVIATLPMLVIFFIGQRYFVEGIATTGRKG